MAQEIVDFVIYDPPHGVKSCPMCGVEYFDDRAFCTECGADISAVLNIRKKEGDYNTLIEETDAATTKEKSGVSLAIKIVGISAAILLVLVVAAFLGLSVGCFI